MNQKNKITIKVLELTNPNYTDADYKKALWTWWKNPRTKKKGGLELTETGFYHLKIANIRNYFIRFESPKNRTNKYIIELDRHFDCPFYFHKHGVYVYGERTAFELVLFDGNVDHFISSRSRVKNT
jgi:hypothetical protein